MIKLYGFRLRARWEKNSMPVRRPKKTLNCQQRTVYGEVVFLTTKEVCRDSTMQLLPYIAIWRGQREDFAT